MAGWVFQPQTGRVHPKNPAAHIRGSSPGCQLRCGHPSLRLRGTPAKTWQWDGESRERSSTHPMLAGMHLGGFERAQPGGKHFPAPWQSRTRKAGVLGCCLSVCLSSLATGISRAGVPVTGGHGERRAGSTGSRPAPLPSCPRRQELGRASQAAGAAPVPTQHRPSYCPEVKYYTTHFIRASRQM